MTHYLVEEIEKNKKDLEIRKHLRTERVALLSELTKGLIAVNSGGLLALLAFIGTLAKDGMTHPMLQAIKVSAVISFGLFGVGIVASLFIPVFLVEHAEAIRVKESERAKAWLATAGAAAGVGFAGIIIGILILGWGLSHALGIFS